MPIYDFFVILKNLDFRALFVPYWKRDELYIGFDSRKLSIYMPSNIKKHFDEIIADIVLRNYEIIEFVGK